MRFSETTSPGVSDTEREAEVLRRLREMQFGTVEIIVHQGRITEVKVTIRERFQ